MRFALLQVGQFLLDGWIGIASGQPAQMLEHSLRPLVFEPVQHSVQPGGGQSPSCCLRRLPDLIDVFSGMAKIQDAHGLRTVVVDQPSQPLRSILHFARPAVALLTWSPSGSWSRSRACSNGIQPASRTSVSSTRGVPPPLTSPNCSSRGKKASPTGRAGAIGARQLDRFSSGCLDPAGLLSTCPQRLATRRTPRTLLLRDLTPILSLPHLHHVLDQLCPQLVHPFIHCRFDLGPRRFRVLFPPLGHPQDVSQSCAHLLHLLTALPSVLLCFLH